MDSRSQLRWAAVLAVLATLLNMEVDPTGWTAEEATNFKRDAREIFDYVTKPEEVPEVYSFVALVAVKHGCCFFLFLLCC